MRYFFDLLDGAIHEDLEGLECADLKTAKAQAIEVLNSILPPVVSDWPRIAIVVRDEVGRTSFKATVKAQIEIVQLGNMALE